MTGAAPPVPDADAPPHDRDSLGLAVLLAALAGWVDAAGFVRWHVFISFASGNSTRAAAAIGIDWAVVATSGGAILVFVAGVVLGEASRPAFGRLGRAAILALEAALLWAALAASLAGAGEALAMAPLGLAMGVQNAALHRAEGTSVALTFVTGTLVKIGRGTAAALRREQRLGTVLPHCALWCGLSTGAVLGAATARASEAGAIAAAAALASVLAATAGLAARREG